MSAGYGNGGWVCVDDDDLPGLLYVRLVEQSTGRLEIEEFYLDAHGTPIRGSDLRRLDLTRLTALLTAVGGDRGDRAIRDRAPLPGVDLSRLASHYATTFGKVGQHWVSDSMHAQTKAGGVRQAPMGSRPRPALDGGNAPPLRAPEGKITDPFLGQVAAAYYAALSRGDAPAVVLAAQAGVSRRTVHAWVARARSRRIMPPGSQGRIG